MDQPDENEIKGKEVEAKAGQLREREARDKRRRDNVAWRAASNVGREAMEMLVVAVAVVVKRQKPGD